MPTAPDKSTLDPVIFNVELEPHVLTDKEVTKTIPCTECQRACVVTTFMAPAKVKCKDCGGGKIKAATGSQAVVQAGRTPAYLATNLSDCLINDTFCYAVCPKDPTHDMELKDVVHVPNYGPRVLLGYKDGIPQYRQETGELVLHQCKQCACTVQYSTTSPKQLRRVNEPRHSNRSTPDSTETMLGTRD